MTDILWALFYVLGTFAAMLALNWRLALVVIVIVPVMAVLTGYFQNRILRWNRKVRKLNSRITGSFNEGITGAKTTKTLGTEEQTVRTFRALTQRDARRRHRRGPAQCHLYPAGAVCQHHGRGHRAAAGRVYGVRGTAGAGHSIHLHHLCRGHFRAHPDDRRQHRGVYLPPGVYRAGHGPDG
ncbi:MAG: ABC transporter transmembrane domain-containing protein [Oscillospiraceae bacterium]